MTTNHDAARDLERVLFEVKRVIVGQDHMVERLLVALLARGHVLLEGLPGLAKTLAVSTLAQAIGGSFVRLQFTPDLLPSDLIGTRIWRAGEERFDIEWGPVFANLVLTDEINRAPAKVQSALLEVMAERQVSIGGTTRPLPDPFLVLATQNPVESEGVYTLPEAQRDRFLMKVVVGYPSPEEEMEIIRRMGVSPPQADRVISVESLIELQRMADRVYVDTAVAQYAVDLVMATREPGFRQMPELESLIDFGVSPRASLGLIAASRGLALLRGRNYVVPQDTFDVARDVLRHRLMLSYEALAKGLGPDDVLNRILSTVPASSISPIEIERRAEASSPRPSPSATPPPPAPVAPAPASALPAPAAPASAPPAMSAPAPSAFPAPGAPAAPPPATSAPASAPPAPGVPTPPAAASGPAPPAPASPAPSAPAGYTPADTPPPPAGPSPSAAVNGAGSTADRSPAAAGPDGDGNAATDTTTRLGVQRPDAPDEGRHGNAATDAESGPDAAPGSTPREHGAPDADRGNEDSGAEITAREDGPTDAGPDDDRPNDDGSDRSPTTELDARDQVTSRLPAAPRAEPGPA